MIDFNSKNKVEAELSRSPNFTDYLLTTSRHFQTLLGLFKHLWLVHSIFFVEVLPLIVGNLGDIRKGADFSGTCESHIQSIEFAYRSDRLKVPYYVVLSNSQSRRQCSLVAVRVFLFGARHSPVEPVGFESSAD